jgi:hypothetical protein
VWKVENPFPISSRTKIWRSKPTGASSSAWSTCKSLSTASPSTWCFSLFSKINQLLASEARGDFVSPSCWSWGTRAYWFPCDWLCCATLIRGCKTWQIKRDQKMGGKCAKFGKEIFLSEANFWEFLVWSDVAYSAAIATEEQPFDAFDLKDETKSVLRL